MKQYKLIKEYPGSPKLGYITCEITSFHTLINVYTDYPEYWELVIEKEYEILSFKKGCFILNVNNGRVRHEDCPNATGSEIEYCKYPIHSIKRISDGEIFTIGDEINGECGKNQEIVKIDIDWIYYRSNDKDKQTYTYRLNKISKSRQSLFKTEDGVDIYKGDIIYIVYNDKHQLNTKKHWSIDDHSPRVVDNRFNQNVAKENGCIWFSTKEKAEEYIMYNKLCLSINDIIKKWWLNRDIGKLETELIELVKSKS